MESFRYSFTVVLMAVPLAGCSSYPNGMSKAEWESLSPAHQPKILSREMSERAHDTSEFVRDIDKLVRDADAGKLVRDADAERTPR